MTGTAPRYALYWAPPADSALWRFGSGWLGRDAESGWAGPPAGLPDLSPDEAMAITAEPRRYGFHGTLKPPFRLADGRIEEELTDACAGFAAGQAAFEAPALVLRRIGSFLALVPAEPSPAIDRLAARAVIDLDSFRAPAPPEELAERRKRGLSPRQEGYLVTWGYPHVLQDFRFHLTLTGRLEPARAEAVERGLQPLVAGFGVPFRIAEVALFLEPAPKQPMRLLRRFALRG